MSSEVIETLPSDWGAYEEDRFSDCVICGRAFPFYDLTAFLECPDCEYVPSAEEETQ